MKRETVNYTLVGLFVLAALAALIATLFAITGRGGSSTSYLVRYDNVTGLTYGAPVFFEGYRIGQVDGITPDHTGTGQGVTYVVDLAVQEGWPIPADSVARLASSGLLADVSIAIKEGKSPTVLEPGAYLKGEEATDVFAALNELAGEVTVLTRERIRPLVELLSTRVDSITHSIDEKTPALLDEAQALMQKLGRASESLDQLLGPENRENVAATLENIRNVSAELEGTQERLDAMLTDVQAIAAENRPTIRDAVLNLSQITAAISRRIDAIAHNLESSSRNLDEFSREIRKSPNRLLFTPPADDVEVESE